MNKFNKRYMWFNITVNSLLSLVLIGLIISINKYGSLSKNIFLFINIAFLVFSLTIILLTIKMNISQRKNLRIFYSFGLVLLLFGSSYGLYLASVVDSNIKIITTEDDKNEYFASFVVYNSNINNIEQLDNKTLGIIESQEFIEGNVLAQDELKKLKLDNVKFEKYHSYPALINGLVKDEVDFISLPKNFRNLYSQNEELKPYLNNLRVVHNFSGFYNNLSKISSSDIDVTTTPFTVLLMGVDDGRTDTLMLASVNPKAMQITLTSIARDSYVPIACYTNKSRDKINHARMVSRDCAIKTVEDVFDLSIDFFAEINFQGVVDFVDAMGTLEIDSPAAFYGNIESEEGGSVYIPKGLSELDGNQVLAFVRERDSFEEGDFQRQANQQQVIKRLISTIMETRDVNTLINLVKAAGRNIETNMALSQMIDLMNLGINRMNSSYLNNADIFSIYGNRLSGRGVMIYSPDYNMDLWYLLLYNGSIADSKDFIAMNMRSDGILEIPKGFNYDFNSEYIPPNFTLEYYYEDIDSDINLDVPRPDSDEEPINEPDDENMIEVVGYQGKKLSELQAYADEMGFLLELNIVEKETDNELFKDVTDEDMLRFVFDYEEGIKLNQGDVLPVTVTQWKYIDQTSQNQQEDDSENKSESVNN